MCPSHSRFMFLRKAVVASAVLALTSPGRLEAAEVWTLVNDTDPAASYSSGVRTEDSLWYFHGDLHTTHKPGEWASFAFVGTGVKWIGAKNVDHGEADVYIDGKLDASLSTSAPTWLKQQEIYKKTGLNPGSHVMKIVATTPGYEDFDAFAYLGAPPRAVEMPEIAGVTLPPLQPLLNGAHRYPVGNGVVAGVFGPDGQIETVYGPGYTTSDLIAHEELFIRLDGPEEALRVDMRRAARTGLYYGATSRGDLDIGVVDFACAGQPWISRLLVIKNRSTTATHAIVVRDAITPHTTKGYTHGLVRDAASNPVGIFAQADPSIGVPYGGSNPVDKSVLI